MSIQLRALGLLALLAAVVLLSAPPSAARVLPVGKFSIRIGGGWSAYAMSDINDNYADEFINEVWDNDMWQEHITNGPHLYGEVDYSLNSRFSVGLGVAYLYAESDGGWDFTDSMRRILPLQGTMTLSTTLVAYELRGRYHLSSFFGSPYLGGGVAWCFGKIATESDSFEPNTGMEFEANGLGFEFLGGTAFNLNSTLALGVEFGYRYYTTDELSEDPLETPFDVSALEFIGPFARLVTTIKL